MGQVAEMKITVEVRCPGCGAVQRYHELSAVQTNCVRALDRKLVEMKTDVPANISIQAKCPACGKKFEITDVKLPV